MYPKTVRYDETSGTLELTSRADRDSHLRSWEACARHTQELTLTSKDPRIAKGSYRRGQRFLRGIIWVCVAVILLMLPLAWGNEELRAQWVPALVLVVLALVVTIPGRLSTRVLLGMNRALLPVLKKLLPRARRNWQEVDDFFAEHPVLEQTIRLTAEGYTLHNEILQTDYPVAKRDVLVWREEGCIWMLPIARGGRLTPKGALVLAEKDFTPEDWQQLVFRLTMLGYL